MQSTFPQSQFQNTTNNLSATRKAATNNEITLTV